MDNVTSLPSHLCIIKPNPFQYAFYKQSHIQIHSSEGILLAKPGDVRIPAQEFTGLSNMLSKVNEFLHKQSKQKQKAVTLQY